MITYYDINLIKILEKIEKLIKIIFASSAHKLINLNFL
jgi:hypothetical protein